MARSSSDIAYLFHHNALVDGEAAVLQQMGHRIYLPLKCALEPGFYDPLDVLQRKRNWNHSDQKIMQALDTFDFYTGTVSAELIQILLSNFDFLVVSLLNSDLLQKCLLATFNTTRKQNRWRTQRIYIRVFGRETPYNYDHFLQHTALKELFCSPFNTMNYLLSAYHEVSCFEPEVVAQHTLTLPLPLDQQVRAAQDTWTGGTKKLMFVCSRIDTPYYQDIWHRFLRDIGFFFAGEFGLFGKQSVSGLTELGKILQPQQLQCNLSRDQFLQSLQQYQAMYYHSVEPRHIHYHPLEAIAVGLPVVFMKPSLLDKLTGGKSSGACESVSEARTKLKRIFDQDVAFTRQLVSDNREALTHFSNDNYIANAQPLFTIS